MQDCVFCKIVRGDLPAYKLYEDDRVIAFLDINPVSTGHSLVIPKSQDCANIFDISNEDWLAVANAVHIVAPALEKATGADGVNIMMNNRSHAGQVVFHPHVHIIPRFKNDGLGQWTHRSYKQGEAEEVLKKITAELN